MSKTTFTHSVSIAKLSKDSLATLTNKLRANGVSYYIETTFTRQNKAIHVCSANLANRIISTIKLV